MGGYVALSIYRLSREVRCALADASAHNGRGMNSDELAFVPLALKAMRMPMR